MEQYQDKNQEYLRAVLHSMSSFANKVMTLDMYRSVVEASEEFAQHSVLLSKLIYEEENETFEIYKDYYELYMNGFESVISKGGGLLRQLETIDPEQKEVLQEVILSQNLDFYNNYTQLLTKNLDSFSYKEVEILENLLQDVKNFPESPKHKEKYAYILDTTGNTNMPSPSQSLMDEAYEINRFYDKQAMVFLYLEQGNVEEIVDAITQEYTEESIEREFTAFVEGKEVFVAEDYVKKTQSMPSGKMIKFGSARHELKAQQENEIADDIAERLIGQGKLFGRGANVLFRNIDNIKIDEMFDMSAFNNSLPKSDALILSSILKENDAELVKDWKKSTSQVKEKVQEILMQKKIFADEHTQKAIDVGEKLQKLVKMYFNIDIPDTALEKNLPNTKHVIECTNKILDSVIIKSFSFSQKQANILSFSDKFKSKEKE